MSQLRTLIVSCKWISLLTGMLILLTTGDLGAPTTAWSQQVVANTAAPNPVGTVFSYQGRLSTNTGPASGNYDFRFTLYDAESGGNAIGTAVEKPNVPVAAGAFTVLLDFGAGAFTGAPRWLEIAVRQAGNGAFENLSPRQPLTPAPYAIYADNTNLNTVQARVSGTCADGSSIRVISGDGTVTCEPDDIGGNNHNHLGQTWTGNNNPLGLNGSFTTPVLSISNSGNGDALFLDSASENGLDVRNSSKYAAIYAESKGQANSLYAENNNQYASIYAENKGSGDGVFIVSQSGRGGWFATFTGANIIEAWDVDSYDPVTNTFFGNTRFLVTRDGNVKADVGFNTPAADFAEMLPARLGLVPGDVLVVGITGELERSTVANSTNVAGVYSTQPGFLGGADSPAAVSAATLGETGSTVNTIAKQARSTKQETDVSAEVMTAATSIVTTTTVRESTDETVSNKIPLAILGVVPVKVTTENGPIQPGDLLTTASTPGHAMKASPVNLSGIELYRPGTILGKALEPWADGAGMIQVLIVLQ